MAYFFVFVLLSMGLSGCGLLIDNDGDGEFDILGGYDCNDFDPSISPGEPEICGDGVDNDCDGQIDESDAINAQTFYQDLDQDGFGNPDKPVLACTLPPLAATNAFDCDDLNPQVHIGAPERCDDIDNNCDGMVNDCDRCTLFFFDEDGDGFGWHGQYTIDCSAPSGYVATPGDCDPLNRLAYPGALEIEDGIDNDCNGWVDDTCGLD